MKDVLRQLKNTKSAVIPAVLIALFRSVFPNFAEQQNGRFKQQDAEEAWTQMLWCLKKIPKTAEVKVSGADLVEQLFSGKLEATVKCIEAPDEPATIKEEILEGKLPCNIDSNTNFLTDGLKLSLESQIEKASPSLGRDALYKEVKRISALPYYLPIQFVRFFWKAKEQVKAKILRVRWDFIHFISLLVGLIRWPLDSPSPSHSLLSSTCTNSARIP
jgi:ubiquitin carboxyl-terminal hydrolase 14